MNKFKGFFLFLSAGLPVAANAQLLQLNHTQSLTYSWASVTCPAPACEPSQSLEETKELIDTHGSIFSAANVSGTARAQAEAHSYSSVESYDAKATIYAGASGAVSLLTEEGSNPDSQFAGTSAATSLFQYSGSFELVEEVHFFIGSFAHLFEFGTINIGSPTELASVLFSNYDNSDLSQGLITETGILPAGSYGFRLASRVDRTVPNEPLGSAQYATQLRMIFSRDELENPYEPGPIIGFIPEINAQGAGLSLGLLALMAMMRLERARQEIHSVRYGPDFA